MHNFQATVLIDISDRFGRPNLKPHQLIQIDKLNKLIGLIDNTLRQQVGAARYRRNNIFFIDGTRGAGKTTFLEAASEYLTKNDRLPGLPPKGDWTLFNLIRIDPTLIETGEHVFFTVLAALADAVESTVKKHPEGKQRGEIEVWRKSLKNLAKGVNLLGAKNAIDFSDDYLNLDQGLANARSGARLEEAFRELVYDASKIVGVDAFLLSFDDVDTDFTEGYKVLELIRRYLQCPQLIVLITGDLQLYTHLVRAQQFHNLGNALHEQDTSRADERSRLVDHLEQQYLLKLFPLPNRIHLSPLAQIIEGSRGADRRIDFRIVHRGFPLERADGNPDSTDLESIIFSIVRDGFSVADSNNANFYKDFLLGLPTRALIQILQVYFEDPRSDNKARILANSLRGTLLGSLYKLGLDVDALSYGDLGKLIEAVFSVVTRNGEFDTGCYLRPQPSDETLKNGFVGLAAEVASQCYQRPDKSIRYLLQGPGSLTLAHLYMPLGNAEEIEDYFSVFRKEFSIGRQEDALNWARYAATVLLSPTEQEGIGPGVLKLSGRQKKQEDGTTERNFKPGPLQEIAFLVAKHHVMSGSTRTYMSVFNLLGAMERLLKLGDLTDQEMEREVARLLRRLVSTVTISAPSWLSRKGGPNVLEGEGGDQASDPVVELAIDQSLPIFTDWIKKCRNIARQLAPSALMIGKIWTRLYFSLARAQSSYRSRQFGAGTIMHMNTMCLINAFLVEEFDYGKNQIEVDREFRMSRSNPSTSSFQVIQKLERLRKLAPLELTHPFTMVLVTCPLIQAFVPSTTECSTSPKSFFRQKAAASRIIFDGDEELYEVLSRGLEQLNQEDIQGRSASKSSSSW